MDDIDQLTNEEVLAAAPRLNDRHYDPPGSKIGNHHFAITQCRGREALLPWLIRRWQGRPALAFSLTFAISGRNAPLHAIVRQIHKHLSYQVYGHAARRYKKRLGFLVVWEGFPRNHPHCHGLLEIPPSRAGFQEHVRRLLVTHPAIGKFDLRPCADVAGWIDYVLKLKDKGDLLQDIDWIAFHSHCI